MNSLNPLDIERVSVRCSPGDPYIRHLRSAISLTVVGKEGKDELRSQSASATSFVVVLRERISGMRW